MKRLLFLRKRWLLPSFLLLLLLLFSAALILPRPAPSSSEAPPKSEEPGSVAVFSSEEEPAGWLLAERAGQVAVYSGGRRLFSTDIEPRTLRASDRELLRRGIEADSMEAILMLIEDLSS